MPATQRGAQNSSPEDPPDQWLHSYYISLLTSFSEDMDPLIGNGSVSNGMLSLGVMNPPV